MNSINRSQNWVFRVSLWRGSLVYVIWSLWLALERVLLGRSKFDIFGMEGFVMCGKNVKKRWNSVFLIGSGVVVGVVDFMDWDCLVYGRRVMGVVGSWNGRLMWWLFPSNRSRASFVARCGVTRRCRWTFPIIYIIEWGSIYCIKVNLQSFLKQEPKISRRKTWIECGRLGDFLD